MVYRIKQYDTKTAMRATLRSEGHPVDLRQVQEVRFLMRDQEQLLINKPVFVVDDINGKVWFPLEEHETSKAGKFRGEFLIIFIDGRRETFPNVGYIPLEISTSNYALVKSEEV
jgi:hypothetical protein